MAISHLFKLLSSYTRTVEASSIKRGGDRQTDLAEWRDRLFIQFLIYCFPVSLLALIPGVCLSYTTGYFVTGTIDLVSFLLITLTTFARQLSLKLKKIIVITVFYTLAIVLITTLGYIGPGIFYLLAITIFIALFFPVRFAVFSIISNFCVLLFFAYVIFAKPFPSVLSAQYQLGEWIAYSSNLIFLSIILVVLIQKIFNGLQATIDKKERHKAKYQSMFEHNPMPMWLFDPKTLKFLDVNNAAIAAYGYTRDEFLAMTIKDIRPVEYHATIESIVELHTGIYSFHHDNMVHVKKDGSLVNVKIDSSLLDFNGITAKLVLTTDITAQIKHEQEVIQVNNRIKQSASNLRAIVESAVQGFVLLDAEDRVIVSNSKAKGSIKLISGQSDFIEGEHIYTYIARSRAPFFKSLLSRVRNGEVIAYDREHTDRDGAKQWINYTLTPVFEGNNIIGTCISGENITTYKRYVQTIEAQNKKFLEVSWIQSHLVRAPLARIKGLVYLIKGEQDEAERQQMFSLLEVSANELDAVIADITQKLTETDLEELKVIR